MVKSCFAYGCTNVWKPNQGIQYHIFPLKRPDILDKWLKAVRLQNFKPNNYSLLCSKHFTEDSYSESSLVKRRLKTDAVPSLFSFPSYYQTDPIPNRIKTERVLEIEEGSSTVGSPDADRNLNKVLCTQHSLNVHLNPIDTEIVKMEDEEKCGFGFQQIKTEIENPEQLDQLFVEEIDIKQEYEHSDESISEVSAFNSIETLVKTEIIEAITEIREAALDDLDVQNQEPYIKESAPYLNQSSSAVRFDQTQLKDTDSRSSLGQNIRQRKNKKNMKYKCKQCKFQTVQKKRISTHLIQHQSAEDLLMDHINIQETIIDQTCTGTVDATNTNAVIMYRCDTCFFETKYKNSIKQHITRHSDGRLVKLQCYECEWETSHKGHLINHMQVHRNRDSKNKFKCDQCDYRSFKRSKLQEHQLNHKSIHEVEMLECNKCSFQSRFQSSLKSHLREHKRKDLIVHKCTKCDYQTNKAFDIRMHLLSHENENCLLYTADLWYRGLKNY